MASKTITSGDPLIKVVSPEKAAHIYGVSIYFPERASFNGDSISDRFNIFSAMRLKGQFKEMLEKVLYLLKGTDRTGWTQMGFPKEFRQSVDEHSQRMIQVLSYMCALNKDTYNQAIWHDSGEVLTSDFTPRDDITKKEKLILETLAADIIFHPHSDEKGYWEDYENRIKSSAKIVKDADILELYAHTLYVAYKCSNLRETVINEVLNKPLDIKTPDGLKILKTLEEDKIRAISGYAPKSDFYTYMNPDISKRFVNLEFAA